MYILIPGRHHLLTDFQFKYLLSLVQGGLQHAADVYGKKLGVSEPVTAIIFAVTSSNHSNTRRNPVPFYQRSLAIQDFCRDLEVPGYIFGVDDIGTTPDFASYTIKRIEHESDGVLDIRPDNTIVLCSTPVYKMYEVLGYKILPGELEPGAVDQFRAVQPWTLVERIASLDENWTSDTEVLEHIHPATYRVWSRYKIGGKVQMFFRDKIVGQDGDLTETRDYNSYVRQMDDIAVMKYKDTETFIRPGRIGDIGCAVGSWIKLACLDERLRESDFYGIEVSRHLFELCQQRKLNKEFANPNVFFSQKNAVAGLVFERNSMNTVFTSSLTHEIESYGSREDLLAFIANRFDELKPGGVWINRDVVGPENKDREVLLWLQNKDGRNEDWEADFTTREELQAYLDGLSTLARFKRFARDFRRAEGFSLPHKIEIRQRYTDPKDQPWEDQHYVRMTLENACEFVTKKDYTDNWKSEMHERFCFWSFDEWKSEMIKAGYKILSSSVAFSNPWIVENRFKNKVELYTEKGGDLSLIEFPVTTMFLIAEKP